MTLSEFSRKIFGRMMVGNCLGMAAAVLLLLCGLFFFLGKYTHHGEEVEVPNLYGMNEETAVRKLRALGLEAEVADTGYVYSQAAFAVLEQSVKAGERVKPGRIISLTINADAPRKIAIPDVEGNCSRREAEDKLRVLGFKLGAPEYVKGDPDWVMAVKVGGREVQPGTKVSISSPVTLVVGVGGNDEEYNGNDSLDYILNAPEEEFDAEEGGEETAE